MGRVSTHAALGLIASILFLAQPVVIAAVFLAVILANTDLFLFLLLTLYAAVPTLGVLSLVLEFAALHSLGDVYQRKDLQKNALRFVVSLLGGTAAFVPLVILLALTLGDCRGNLCRLLSLASLWAAAWLLMAVVPYRFLAKAYAALGEAADSDAFRKAAKWSWRGALLFIVLVGALLILAARIYALKGYHALKKAADPNPPPP
jgi:uncharacterized membrane protein